MPIFKSVAIQNTERAHEPRTIPSDSTIPIRFDPFDSRRARGHPHCARSCNASFTLEHASFTAPVQRPRDGLSHQAPVKPRTRCTEAAALHGLPGQALVKTLVKACSEGTVDDRERVGSEQALRGGAQAGRPVWNRLGRPVILAGHPSRAHEPSRCNISGAQRASLRPARNLACSKLGKPSALRGWRTRCRFLRPCMTGLVRGCCGVGCGCKAAQVVEGGRPALG